MKNFTITLLFIFISFSSQSQLTDWTALNLNAPLQHYTRSISVVDANIIWGLIRENDNSVVEQFFKTTDGGQTFETGTLPFSVDNGVAFHIHALDENIAFTATSTGSGGIVEGVHRTIDGGQNWELILDNQANNMYSTWVYFFDNQNGVVRCNESDPFTSVFYYTEDGGDTWTKSISEFEINSSWSTGGNAGFDAVGDTIWSSTVNDVIFKSTDKGKTWEAYNTGLNSSNVTDIAFKDNLNGLAIAPINIDPFVDNILIQTSDGGETWTEIVLQFPAIISQGKTIEYIPGTAGSYIISNGNTGSTPNFFGYTLDNGVNWTYAQAPFSLYCTDFLSPTLGFGGTDISSGGLLKYNDILFGESTAIEVVSDTKVNIFPNPTQDKIFIELEDELQGNLTLRIVNTLGQTVLQQYISKIQNKEKWEIDMSEIPTGSYHLMISNEKQLVVKSIIKI